MREARRPISSQREGKSASTAFVKSPVLGHFLESVERRPGAHEIVNINFNRPKGSHLETTLKILSAANDSCRIVPRRKALADLNVRTGVAVRVLRRIRDLAISLGIDDTHPDALTAYLKIVFAVMSATACLSPANAAEVQLYLQELALAVFVAFALSQAKR